MQSDNYVVIQGWMCNELELKGNELLIFALIYGFSQDGISRFYGNRKYIADTLNISLPTVDKAIEDLRTKNLIIRYVITDDKGTHYEYEVCKETLQGEVKKLYRGGKETLHNNTNRQTNNKKEVLSKDNTTEFEFGGKQKPKKENLYTKCLALIDDKTDDIRIRELLVSWLNMLLEKYKDRGKVLYANVFKGKLNMLDKFDKKDWKEIIEYNLQKGYEGFYPVSFYNSINSESGARHVPTMTREDYEEEEKRLAKLESEGVQVRF